MQSAALLDSYGFVTDFVYFYLGEGASIAMMDGQAIVCGRYSDELGSLLHALSPSVVSGELELMTALYGEDVESGIIFCTEDSGVPWGITVVEDRFERVYRILQAGFGKPVYPSENYNMWYCDMSHRIRHQTAKIFLYEDATATAAFWGKDAVLLSQIACKSSGNGQAGRLLRSVLAYFGGRKCYVNSMNPTADGFYKHLGFSPVGQWGKKTR